MKINFKTSGICCREMNFSVDENNIITDVEFVGDKLEGTTCGSKMTSCPDQLSKAIKENIK